MLLGHRPGTTSESSHITVSHSPFRPVLSPAPRPVSMSSRKKIIFPAPDAFVFLSSQNRRCGAAPHATHILIEKAVACRALRHRPAAEATLPLPCTHRISPPPRRLCRYPALIVFHRHRDDSATALPSSYFTAAEAILPLPCPPRIAPPPKRFCRCPALIVFHRRRDDSAAALPS